MILLSFQNVVKKYHAGSEELRAVDNVSLDIVAGEMVAVMGPSGCGKSTLLHLAGGLEPTTAGQVVFEGVPIDDRSPVQLARMRRRDLGYVFQSLNLIDSLTALENVTLPLELDGVSTRKARAEATDRLAAVGLTHQLNRFPSEFSGGQRQRIAIARALVGGRRLILADEPTGALDTATGDGVITLLSDLAASGVSVLLVTHEPRFASWADRVVFMRDGHIVDQSFPAPDDASLFVDSAVRP